MKQSIKRALAPLVSLLRLPGRLELHARVAASYSRAAATAAARHIDPRRPLSWEFSAFSQHGEDGIQDYLCSHMLVQNRFFVEIGAADGLQNCSAWLAFARRYGGVMVDGHASNAKACRRTLQELRCHNVTAIHRLVDRDNVEALMKLCPCPDPDVFILDIDGIDYYILERVLALGFAPKLITVEYNSAFGPERAITVPYEPRFSRGTAHPSRLYYGASIAAWKHLLARHGYEFVTVDSNGVNAFFVNPAAFPANFVEGWEGVPFLENISDRNGATAIKKDAQGDLYTPVRDWNAQFALMHDETFVEVETLGES